MNYESSEQLSDTQKQLQELRERLKKNTESMNNSAKKIDVNQAMSAVITTIGTFEKS
ncbi:hypothetical protein [Vibrio rhodolitus]|uniref:hypothetical protein n=1 Tax=Vibrio rhodolitus TaxID=2231649 RepID=UPI0013DF36FD|nr:hypothetical protein [Vibrio rhodolitus]